MSILDNRFYRWLEVGTDFFLLNLLWLLACLPVVTIFPSTAAMFGVVRDWVRKKEGSTTRTFVARFRENFRQSLMVSAIWTIFGVALYLDFLVADQLSFWAQVLLRSLLVLALSVYALVSVFLFPVMVHYDTDWKTVIKNALLLSIGRLPTTLVCLALLVAMALLTTTVPLLLVITGSITAYVIYRLCDREFSKLDDSESV